MTRHALAVQQGQQLQQLQQEQEEEQQLGRHIDGWAEQQAGSAKDERTLSENTRLLWPEVDSV